MYEPNKFSLAERWFCGITAVALFVYGLYGVINEEITLPARKGGFTLQGEGPTILVFVGFALWAASLLSVVADHYDERENEESYGAFSKWCGRGGVVMLLMGVALQLGVAE